MKRKPVSHAGRSQQASPADYPRLTEIWGEEKLAAMRAACTPDTLRILELVPSRADLEKWGDLIKTPQDSIPSISQNQNAGESDVQRRNRWNSDVVELNYGDVLSGIQDLRRVARYMRLDRTDTVLEISGYGHRIGDGWSGEEVSNHLGVCLAHVFEGTADGDNALSREMRDAFACSGMTSQRAVAFRDGSGVIIRGYSDGKVEMRTGAHSRPDQGIGIARMETALNALRQLGVNVRCPGRRQDCLER